MGPQWAGRVRPGTGRRPPNGTLPSRLATRDGLRQTAADADQLVGSLEAAQQELPERITTLDEQLAAARLAGAGLAGLREQQAAISRQADAAGRLAGVEQRLAA